MKTLYSKISLIVLLIIGIAAIGFLYSCEKDKEEAKNDNQTQVVSNSPPKDYKAYIEDLIATTGIDIYALSELDGVKKLAEKNLNMISRLEKSSTKGELTEAKAIRIKNLATTAQAKYDAGDYGAVLTLFESLCEICATIDGFMFDVNEYGMQTITYDPNMPAVRLPLAQMEAERLQVTRLREEISIVSPQFVSLPQPVQAEVLSAAMYISSESLSSAAKLNTKAFSVNDPGGDPGGCRQLALEMYTNDMRKYNAMYIGGMMLCTGTGFLAWACYGLATIAYADAMTSATRLYNGRIADCNSRGYFNY